MATCRPGYKSPCCDVGRGSWFFFHCLTEDPGCGPVAQAKGQQGISSIIPKPASYWRSLALARGVHRLTCVCRVDSNPRRLWFRIRDPRLRESLLLDFHPVFVLLGMRVAPDQGDVCRAAAGFIGLYHGWPQGDIDSLARAVLFPQVSEMLHGVVSYRRNGSRLPPVWKPDNICKNIKRPAIKGGNEVTGSSRGLPAAGGRGWAAAGSRGPHLAAGSRR